MKRILVLLMLSISIHSFSQITFHSKYLEIGSWNNEIEDYDIIQSNKANISIEAYEKYAIFTTPNGESQTIYWEFNDEISTPKISYFLMNDWYGEEALITFNEENDVIYIFMIFNQSIDNWTGIMILSDIEIENR